MNRRPDPGGTSVGVGMEDDLPEVAVDLLVGPGREEQDVLRAGEMAVAEAEPPEPVDNDLVSLVPEEAAEAVPRLVLLTGAPAGDHAVAEVSDDHARAEAAPVRGRLRDAP